VTTLLKDFVITAMLWTSGGYAGCCVIKDCVITVTTFCGDLFGHVWAATRLTNHSVFAL
jgi:hypothetical protein